jgi:hypothetical protein
VGAGAGVFAGGDGSSSLSSLPSDLMLNHFK